MSTIALAVLVAQLGAPAIRWEPWSLDVFTRAQAEGRFVILDLEATWCHWCHVMDEITYRDAAVVALIGEKYIAVRADQDASPELAHRYEDYGWPATIVFAPDGSELVRRRGYINPSAMAAMLRAIIADPSPGPSVTRIAPPQSDEGTGALGAEARRAIERRFRETYDRKHGGWGTIHKYVDGDNLEYALDHAPEMARETLAKNLALIDPVWGGVYQYSDLRNPADPWGSPHYEKIMSFQARDLRLYALAHARWKDPKYLGAARDIDRFLENFLTAPNGAFYASQNADPPAELEASRYFALGDEARRALGVPRIDRNIYPRETGWAIVALAKLADVTRDESVLARAIRAAEAVRPPFKHGDDPRPYLGDTLAMGEAFLALHASTADRRWLDEASAAARIIEEQFRDGRGGYFTAAPVESAPGVHAEAVRQIDENIAVARFANLLARYTGNAAHRPIAEHAMRYLSSPRVTNMKRSLAGVLLAADELAHEPFHLVVVGKRSDERAGRLFAAARALPDIYRKIEWWDPSGPKLPRQEVEYPVFAQPAVFACSENICSPPIFDSAALASVRR